MANTRRPKESGSAAQLAAASAFLDIAEAATHRSPPMTANDVVNRAVVLVANVKKLQPYQQDELTMFLAERLGVFEADANVVPSITGSVSVTLPDDETDAERDLRQEAAVDQLVAERQLTIEDGEKGEDPKAVAEELAARVHDG